MPLSFYKTNMMKNITIYVSIIFALLFSAEYDVGDTVDLDDQDQRFTVCNGEHFNNDLSLSDLNGDLNGGHYFVSWFDISATW